MNATIAIRARAAGRIRTFLAAVTDWVHRGQLGPLPNYCSCR